MKNYIRSEHSNISLQDYAEGRTLMQIKEMERDDFDGILIPKSATYLLRFALFKHPQTLAFYVDDEEFNSLLTDDCDRIKISAALDANNRTFKKQEHTFTRFQTKLFRATSHYVSQILEQDMKNAQKALSDSKTKDEN